MNLLYAFNSTFKAHLVTSLLSNSIKIKKNGNI